MNEDSGGFVYFIGAGPGDPGLLTIRGQQLLLEVDIVIFDRLVSPQILQMIPESTQKICAESLPGCHPERISVLVDLMLKNAKNGFKVARLKGGDPLLFGRGSEEIEPLIENRILFEIVPGVTAAFGASAYCGLPLTHRGFSSAVAFITGHEKEGKTDSFLNWSEIARFPGTLVFYMGVKRAHVIQSNLISQGMKADTPVAIISDATLPTQKNAVSVLDDLTNTVAKENLHPPAIIIIGEAAKYLGRWDWRGKLLLGGASILIARPKGQADGFADKLKNLGANVFQFDSMAIKSPDDWSSVDREINQISSFDWIVFTSANGVEKFFNRFVHLGVDIRRISALKIACVGPATASALKQFHVQADLVPSRHDAEGLINALYPLVENKKVLLARAKEGRPLLAQELAKICNINEIQVYSQSGPEQHQINQIKTQISHKAVDYVAVTSSNNAKILIEYLGDELKAGIASGSTKLIAISPLTADELKKLGFNEIICPVEFTTNGITAEIIRDYGEKKQTKVN